MNTHAKAENSVENRHNIRQQAVTAQIPRDVALSIALATRALSDTVTKDLLQGLIALVGEPLTCEKLAKLNIKRLKQLSFLQDTEPADLKKALDCLQSQGGQEDPDSIGSLTSLPPIQAPFDDTLPQGSELPALSGEESPEQGAGGNKRGYIQVACASNSGDQIDGHFGSCARFLIYQVSPEKLRLVDIRIPDKTAAGDDKNFQRAQLIHDCHVLYTVSIGGPAAAKVVRAGLHPIKLPNGGAAPIILDRLRTTIAEAPPPWLAKVMGIAPEHRVRFSEEEEND